MKKQFIPWSAALILLRLLDLWTTFRGSSDLSDEINPIHSLFSGGWTMIILVNIMVVTVVLWLYYFYLTRYVARTNIENTESYTRFLSSLYFGKPGKFHQVFYRMPNDKSLIFGHMGYVLMRTAVFGSLLAVLNNTFHYYRLPFYERWCDFIVHPAWFIYGLIFLFSMACFYRFTFKEYLANKIHGI